MKRIVYSILLLVFFGFGEMNAQLSINFHSGYNTVNKSNLEELNEYMIANLPFDAEIVDNFPHYFYYQGELVFTDLYLEWGLNVGFTSTGSRVSYADYSGNYTLDNLLSAWNLGVFLQRNYRLSGGQHIILFLETGMLISQLNMKESLTIGELSEANDFDFSSSSYYISPGIKYYYPVLDFLHVGLRLTYLIDTDKDYHLGSNKNAILTIQDSGKRIKSNWDGFRLGLMIELSLDTWTNDQTESE